MSSAGLFFRVVLLCVLSASVSANAPSTGQASEARIVSTRVVATMAERRSSSDLVAFNGQLLVTFVDQAERGSEESCIRVMASKDGAAWKTVETIRQQDDARKFLHEGQAGGSVRYRSPQFAIVNAQRLSLLARDRVREAKPVNAGIRTVTWSTSDGSRWDYDGPTDLGGYFGRPAWDEDAGYCCEFGTQCGSASTIQIWRTEDGRHYRKHFKHTFRDMPRDASMLFVDDKAYCLLPRCGFAARLRLVDGVIQLVEKSPTGKSTFEPAILGSATFPYLDWEWKELGTTIFSPSVIHVPGQGTFAVVEIRTNPERTSLCRLDLRAGALHELVRLGDLRQQQMGPPARLPESEKYMQVGLAAHDDHLWVSYMAHNEVKVVKIALE